MQKRASPLARATAAFLSVVLIFPLLTAGLLASVGLAGGEDRGAVAHSGQVAPEGCTSRLRSPGDEISRPAEVILTVALSISGSHWTVKSFSFSAGVEGSWPVWT